MLFDVCAAFLNEKAIVFSSPSSFSVFGKLYLNCGFSSLKCTQSPTFACVYINILNEQIYQKSYNLRTKFAWKLLCFIFFPNRQYLLLWSFQFTMITFVCLFVSHLFLLRKATFYRSHHLSCQFCMLNLFINCTIFTFNCALLLNLA